MNSIGISIRSYMEGFLHGAKGDGGFDRLMALAEDVVVDPCMPGQLADLTADPIDENTWTLTAQAWRCWGHLVCAMEAPAGTKPHASAAAIFVYNTFRDRT